MSETRDWSPAFVAWKLFETVIEAEGVSTKDMSRSQILDLFSDCASAVEGEYVSDIEDLSDDLDEDDFDDDDEFDDEDDD